MKQLYILSHTATYDGLASVQKKHIYAVHGCSLESDKYLNFIFLSTADQNYPSDKNKNKVNRPLHQLMYTKIPEKTV